MKVDNFFDLLGLTVILAMVTDVFTSKQTAGIVTNGGTAWAGIISSALGKG